MKSVALASSLFLLSVAVAGQASAAGAAPLSTAHPNAVDNGLANSSDTIEIGLALKISNIDDLKAFVASTVNPASSNYHQFLTTAQFAARYGQSEASVRKVKAYLEANGLQVTKVFDNRIVIMARGTNAQLTALFGTPIHSYTATTGETFQRPTGSVTLPAALQDTVLSVHGLSTEARFRSHTQTVLSDMHPAVPTAATAATSTKSGLVSASLGSVSAVKSNALSPAATTPTFGNPGTYTVKDLATRNNITPLYTAGYTGSGTTLGIMTFASYTASNATTYWNAVGVTRTGSISVVTVSDGVKGDKVGTSGASETSLDVEQSGGVAPGANIIVYEAPNTSAGALALYSTAISANKADTLSISWGESELFYGSSDLAAYDQLFLESASQGVPITASSADAGAYDINGEGFPFPNYSPLLDVDYPASSPYVLGAGGTTLPATLNLAHGTVVVPQERPWGWDYLQSYILSYQTAAYYYANLWPVGGGGGVSVQYGVPSYQAGLAGVRTSMPGQAMYCLVTTAANTSTGVQACTAGTGIVSPALPAGYAGRNVPDVSLNADPETGYALYSTGDGLTGWTTGYGGTSFVAPQLNGIFALLTQKVGHRLGWVHPQIYGAFQTYGYGSGSPFRAITTGTNLFWPATNSYNPATGLGSLDVANLSTIFN